MAEVLLPPPAIGQSITEVAILVEQTFKIAGLTGSRNAWRFVHCLRISDPNAKKLSKDLPRDGAKRSEILAIYWPAPQRQRILATNSSQHYETLFSDVLNGALDTKGMFMEMRPMFYTLLRKFSCRSP